MKKQIITALLAIAFLSTNLLAISSQEQLERLDEELNKQAAQVQGSTELLAAEENEDEMSDDITSYIEASQEKAFPSQTIDSTTNQAAIKQQEREAEWQEQRNELDHYVSDSYWITWKMESIGDVQMSLSLTRLSFIPVHVAAAVFGGKKITEDIEDFITKMILNNQGNKLYATAGKHRTDVLYVKIQRNAFNLLWITTKDYFNLIKEYPEVEYLFNDLYTFFKWRSYLHGYYAKYAATTDKDLAKIYEKYSKATDQNESFYSYLRTNANKKMVAEYLQAPNDYRYNEYFLYKIFRRAARRNSFLAWQQLARIAKQEMLKAVKAKSPLLTTKTAEQEEIAIPDYAFLAHDALEDGRQWNGLQRYAAFHGALPLSMNPRLGSGSPAIGQQIEKEMKKRSKEEVRAAFAEKRAAYLSSRETNPVDIQWKKLIEEYAKNPQEFEQQNTDKKNNPNSLWEQYERTPDKKGEIATPKTRTDPIADDFTLLDEIAEAIMKKAVEL